MSLDSPSQLHPSLSVLSRSSPLSADTVRLRGDAQSTLERGKTNLRRECQLEGIKVAKARGIYKGCKPSINLAEVRRLRDKERLGPTAIARQLGIGRASVYRMLGRQTPSPL